MRIFGLRCRQEGKMVEMRRLHVEAWARVGGVVGGQHSGGARGGPTPRLWCEGARDPAARGYRPADAAWTFTASELVYRLPEDLNETLTRVPVYENVRPYRETEGLH